MCCTFAASGGSERLTRASGRRSNFKFRIYFVHRHSDQLGKCGRLRVRSLPRILGGHQLAGDGRMTSFSWFSAPSASASARAGGEPAVKLALHTQIRGGYDKFYRLTHLALPLRLTSRRSAFISADVDLPLRPGVRLEVPAGLACFQGKWTTCCTRESCCAVSESMWASHLAHRGMRVPALAACIPKPSSSGRTTPRGLRTFRGEIESPPPGP